MDSDILKNLHKVPIIITLGMYFKAEERFLHNAKKLVIQRKAQTCK